MPTIRRSAHCSSAIQANFTAKMQDLSRILPAGTQRWLIAASLSCSGIWISRDFRLNLFFLMPQRARFGNPEKLQIEDWKLSIYRVAFRNSARVRSGNIAATDIFSRRSLIGITKAATGVG